MFKARLVSGVILLTLAIYIILLGGKLLWATSLILSLVGLFELYRALGLERGAASYIGYICTIAYYFLVLCNKEEYTMFLFISTLLVYLIMYVITFPEFKTEQISTAFFGILYVSVLFIYTYKIRSLEAGKYLVWLTLISSWGTDTFAYVVGMLIGKHKVFPKLSPKKSLEGAVGGVIGASFIAFIYASIFATKMVDLANPILSCIVACAIASVISQLGDLAASAIKRNHNIKDYGKLIPGHGGVLDRFDSLLFTAPAIYFAILFF